MLTRTLKDHGLLSLLLALSSSIVLLFIRASVVGHVGAVSDQLSLHWAFNWSGDWPHAVQWLCGTLLLLSGFLVRDIGIRFRLLSTKGWMPVPVTVCFGLLFRHALLRPDLLGGIVISLALVFLILSTYRQDSVLGTLFHVGMLAALAALFHGPGLLLFIVILFSIFILRPGAWREWVMPFMGMAMMLVFIMLILIWHPDPLESLNRTVLSAWTLTISPLSLNAGHGILLVLLGLSLPHVLQEIASGMVQTRNGMLVLLALVAMALLMAVAFGTGWAEAVLWATFPFTILICTLIERATRWWWADLLLLSVFVAVFLGQMP